ncbi:MAG: hypothetical protein HZB11_02395 [Candidatus Yonathbacteria bacterium]|nr:hypothetical protein [Candidatus Yonathbacteria bacterium]
MKKILAGMVVSVMFFPMMFTIGAFTTCDNMPQSVVNDWSTYSEEYKVTLVSSYCEGGSSVSTVPAASAQITGSTAPSGSTAGLSAPTKLQNPIKFKTFSEFAAAVTKTAVQVLMPFIILGFIYAGFLFVSAQGNEKKLTHAKSVLWYSMIGAFVLFGAWGFAQIISKTISAITS